jgi:hypothetical protein
MSLLPVLPLFYPAQVPPENIFSAWDECCGRAMMLVNSPYEVIAEDTTEENVVRRRQPTPQKPRQRQLELVPSPYEADNSPMPKAADPPMPWDLE